MLKSKKIKTLALTVLLPCMLGSGAANASAIYADCTQAANVDQCISDARLLCPAATKKSYVVVIDIPGALPDVILHRCPITLSGGINVVRATLPVDSDGSGGAGGGGSGGGGGGNPAPIPMIDVTGLLEDCHPHFMAINPLTGVLECGWGWPP
jgi:hypothetical protein